MEKVFRNLINKTLFIYLSSVLVCVLILIFTLKLWQADIHIPFAYNGDGLLYGEFIKSTIDNKWYLYNNYVGAPGRRELFDFPMADNLHFIIIKIISLMTNEYAMIFNVFYILGFILTSLTTLFVLRHFRISYWPSLAVTILFTFLTYHYLRIGHLFLASYYLIPLMIMVIIWANTDALPLFFKSIEHKKSCKFSIFNKKTIISLIVCILTASAGIYYAFFACFLLVVCGVSVVFQKDYKKRLTSIVLLIFTIVIGVILNISPTLVNNINNGKNVETAIRSSAEADVYGLLISQLFIPVSAHGIGVITKVKSKFATHPLSSEGSAYLGVIGIIGFIILLIWLLKPREYDGKFSLLNTLATLNIYSLLLATVGGFGSVFALIVSPQIRAYNRISVYISFISLFAVAIIINHLMEKYAKSKLSYSFIVLVVVSMIMIGVIDQTDRAFVPNYAQTKLEFKNDENFVKAIEESMPTEAMIFQLPYVPYPENPPVVNMNDYELFRGYLHSKTLHWSYGSMKGRTSGTWLKDVSSKNINDLVETISFAGFKGIYIDRNGYADGGSEIESRLNELLAIKPIESDNKRLLFYNLDSYIKDKKGKYTEDEWNAKKEEVLHPILFIWSNSSLEGTPEYNWRWFPSEANLEINNPTNKAVKLTLNMKIASGYNEFSNFVVKSNLVSDSFQFNSVGQDYKKTILVPKGNSNIKFLSDASRVNAPADPRVLNFRIINFTWQVEN